MALVRLDGFDLYGDVAGLGGTWQWFTAPEFTTTGGRFGGGAVSVVATNSGIYEVLDNTHNYITIGAAIKSDLNADGYIMAWSEDGSPNIASDLHAGVHVTTTGVVSIRGDGGTSLGATAAGAVTADAWFYIEFSCFRNSSTGTAELFINGISEISVTSVDTRDGTSGSFMHIGAFTTGNDFTIDDVYMQTDASAIPTPFGEIRIETILPDADTAQADWTPLSGSGFSNIDDATGTNGDGDTSYISATTLSDQSEFDMGALTGAPTAIHAIALSTRASRTDAGSIEYTPLIDSGGTESDGTPTSPGDGAYGIVTDIFEVDPNTASAWTLSGVNAVKLGVKISG